MKLPLIHLAAAALFLASAVAETANPSATNTPPKTNGGRRAETRFPKPDGWNHDLQQACAVRRRA